MHNKLVTLLFRAKHRFGFTLIELLLVISIVSILAFVGLSFAKQRMQESKIKKAVIQMQQIMQAATAYYAEHEKWPLSDNIDFKNKYIPAGGIKDPWEHDYAWCPATSSGNCSKQDDKGLFQVETITDKNIANRIKAKLSNAGTIPGEKEKFVIYAQIAKPTQSPLLGIFVAQVGQFQITETTKKPSITKKINFNCPKGYISTIHFNLEFMENKELPGDKRIYLYRHPYIEAKDGCTDTKCEPYTITISVKNTGKVCWADANISQPVPNVTYHCPSGPSDNFYKAYYLNYSIYCCKAGTNYCENLSGQL